MTDVTELFGEVVKKASEDLQILYPDGKGEFVTIKNPDLNYIFGNSQYIKDQLDTYSKSPSQSQGKFPLIALFCPVNESRDSSLRIHITENMKEHIISKRFSYLTAQDCISGFWIIRFYLFRFFFLLFYKLQVISNRVSKTFSNNMQ